MQISELSGPWIYYKWFNMKLSLKLLMIVSSGVIIWKVLTFILWWWLLSSCNFGLINLINLKCVDPWFYMEWAVKKLKEVIERMIEHLPRKCWCFFMVISGLVGFIHFEFFHPIWSVLFKRALKLLKDILRGIIGNILTVTLRKLTISSSVVSVWISYEEYGMNDSKTFYCYFAKNFTFSWSNIIFGVGC